MIRQFSEKDFKVICDRLAGRDTHLAAVLSQFGYPPMWTRPNQFESLVHIILEQQVSLASALASLRQLQLVMKKITPRKILALSDAEMRACYVSRQKAGYIRGLANAILNKEIILTNLEAYSDEEVRNRLTRLKGIGNWTVDVYLIFVLQRADIFPSGDLAAINALKRLKQLPHSADKKLLIGVTEQWAPHRTIATMILWHFYLSVRNKNLPKLADSDF